MPEPSCRRFCVLPGRICRMTYARIILNVDDVVIKGAQLLLAVMVSTRFENPRRSIKANSPPFRFRRVILFVMRARTAVPAVRRIS
jgi:hypothetical protein